MHEPPLLYVSSWYDAFESYYKILNYKNFIIKFCIYIYIGSILVSIGAEREWSGVV